MSKQGWGIEVDGELLHRFFPAEDAALYHTKWIAKGNLAKVIPVTLSRSEEAEDFPLPKVGDFLTITMGNKYTDAQAALRLECFSMVARNYSPTIEGEKPRLPNLTEAMGLAEKLYAFCTKGNEDGENI